MQRQISYSEAINEALDLCMGIDPDVFVMGLGATDPKAIFGTTTGLKDKYGDSRVTDMPASENGMTGVAIGASLLGLRPVMVHQRMDFALLAIEQIVNQAAKWHYMFGGKANVPIVIRMVIGRGWGQGPQHSQSLQSWFSHIPGLKVVMPSTPYDAKGLLISSIEDNNPVIFLEHRWLHGIYGYVPEGYYKTPIGQAQVIRNGRDLTVAATSYMALESIRAATLLEGDGVDVEVIDIRTISPMDEKLIVQSVEKTGRIVVADTGWTNCGFSAEVVSRVTESSFDSLKAAPVRIASPNVPTPTTPALSVKFYPTAREIVSAARLLLDIGEPTQESCLESDFLENGFLDIPDPNFTGPF